jgi:Icc-related predicted phosphoesterase
MTKIICISDCHGQLPIIPECDLLLICGDTCPIRDHSIGHQKFWLDTTFKKWLERVPAKHIVGIAGNHDLIFQHAAPEVPKLPWIYLQDSGIELNGLKIWGTPHTPFFKNWAFNLYEGDLIQRWALIPKDTDIIIVHGPPQGYGDLAPRDNLLGFENTGSPGLLARIKEIKPKLVCFGHIHEGRGQWQIDNTILANCTVVDRQYKNVYKPMEFTL